MQTLSCFVALLWIGIDLISSRFHPMSNPYFFAFFPKQPTAFISSILIATLRVWVTYFIVCFFSLYSLTTLKIKGRLRIAVLFGFYALITYLSLGRFPALSEHFSLKPFFLLTIFFTFVLMLNSRKLEPSEPRWSVFSITIAFILLWGTAKSPIEIVQAGKMPFKKDSASFFLLGFDSIPGDLFYAKEGETAVAPLFSNIWKKEGLLFKNAYSLTNSTFTSWFSILSGRHPLESQVASLYPNPREGVTPLERLLPNVLKEQGYETVFMTDCANTSFMKPEYGFQEMHQTDRGAFLSTKAITESSHPFLASFTHIFPNSVFFPELNTFSSLQYDPESFFERVWDKQKELDSKGRPYLLAVHSCLTHRDLAKHRPSETETAAPPVPAFHGFKTKELSETIASIREADRLLHETLSRIKSHSNLWTFVFSDHGIRMDPKGNELQHFSHALGDAVSRFQYQIPLFVYTKEMAPKEVENLVALQDIRATIFRITQNPILPDPTLLVPLPNRRLTLSSALPNGSPENWGKNLLPLIKRGSLNPSGLFLTSPQDEEAFRTERSLSLIELPYRVVWSKERKWRAFDEEHDPFNQNPLSLDLPMVKDLIEEACSRFSYSCFEQKLVQLDRAVPRALESVQ